MRDYANLITALRIHEDIFNQRDAVNVATLYRDAADAIEELLAEVEHWKLEAAANETDRNYLIDENRKLVNSLMNFRVPKWVSVEERLPEDEGKRYLVASDLMICGLWVSICYFTHNLESVDEYVFAGERRSGFYFCDSEYDHIERDGVRYWMPLPAPPKGVE